MDDRSGSHAPVQKEGQKQVRVRRFWLSRNTLEFGQRIGLRACASSQWVTNHRARTQRLFACLKSSSAVLCSPTLVFCTIRNLCVESLVFYADISEFYFFDVYVAGFNFMDLKREHASRGNGGKLFVNRCYSVNSYGNTTPHTTPSPTSHCGPVIRKIFRSAILLRNRIPLFTGGFVLSFTWQLISKSPTSLS
jgi:hypothetical protein